MRMGYDIVGFLYCGHNLVGIARLKGANLTCLEIGKSQIVYHNLTQLSQVRYFIRVGWRKHLTSIYNSILNIVARNGFLKNVYLLCIQEITKALGKKWRPVDDSIKGKSSINSKIPSNIIHTMRALYEDEA